MSCKTDWAVQSIGGKAGYLLHISWLKAAKARLILERMSLGGSLEILIQVCRMDSGTIFACKSCEAKVRQSMQPSCAAQWHNLGRPLCPCSHTSVSDCDAVQTEDYDCESKGATSSITDVLVCH